MVTVKSSKTKGGVDTTETQWWVVYEASTLLIKAGPHQCSGTTYTKDVMVIADTEEEIIDYIGSNGLYRPDDEPETVPDVPLVSSEERTPEPEV